MRTNYILIDCENVQPDGLASLDADHFKVMLFIGVHQTKLSVEFVAAAHRLGARAQYIQVSGKGPNALDFHIAFYIGELAGAEPAGYFHIISKDKGFDPLIQHLKTRKILAARAKSISEIPLIKATNSKDPEERLEFVVARLRQMKGAKPRTLKALKSAIDTHFHKQLSDPELTQLLQVLQSKGWVTAKEKKLTYKLPPEGKATVSSERSTTTSGGLN